MNTRRGFSLVEILVAIAILAVLMGLMLPAVQRVRTAGARTSSQNNLRQIVLAAHDYEAQHGFLPNYVDLIDDDEATHGIATTFVKLLPHLDQSPLFSEALKDGATALDGTTIKLFLNPSDPSTAGSMAGWTGYVANWNVVGKPKVSLKSGIPDGTSATIFLTERYANCGSSHNTWIATSDGTTLNDTSATVSAVLFSDEQPQFGPTAADCIPERAVAAYSEIQVAWADGSVAAVRRSTAEKPVGSVTYWQAALTAMANEPFSRE